MALLRDAAGKPRRGGDVIHAFAAFSAAVTGGDGTQTTMADYLECRTLKPGAVFLEISQVFPIDRYD